MKRSGRLSYHLCRILLGAFFLYAGFLKIEDASSFAGKVAAYEILPYQWNYVVAATLPWIEVACGVLLLVNRRVRPAALVVGTMNMVFIVALVSVLLRGLDIDCGCFGPHLKSSPLQALLRNVLFLAMAHFVFHLRNKYSLEKTGDRRQKTE